MGYMTFGQQAAQHLQFLQKAGLEVINLTIDSPEFIRCRNNGALGRGEYAYKTVSRTLNNGLIGLMTWCRSESGQINTYKTYGYSSEERCQQLSIPKDACQSIIHDKKVPLAQIRRFWEFSSQCGVSDYLKKKDVGAYHIRFRENQYGKVAVIPMRDAHNTLQGYQILNPNGSKVFAKGIRLTGLFHQLTELTDGLPIGIAESYVTAATCLELVGIPLVTAFSSDNLEQVAITLQQHYPNSVLVMFADNDSHLSANKGVISARKALEQSKRQGVVLIPRFEGYPQTRDYSDWNDLVREIGRLGAIEQIHECLNTAGKHNIKLEFNGKIKGEIK